MNYYYDSEAKVLIAIDPETEDVRVLEPLNFGEDPEPEPARTQKNEPKEAKSRFKGSGCSVCGSPSRHKKDCSKASASKSDKATTVNNSKMSPLDFEAVKEQQRDDMTTDYVAKRFDLNVQEVIDAFASDSYRTYKTL
jgi:hypothetical protein